MRPSKRSMQRFGELCVDYEVLRTIDQLFSAFDFDPVANYRGPETGERRTLVAAYHAGIDLSDPAQASRLVNVYVEALEKWVLNHSETDLPTDISAFIRGLKRDGIAIDDAGRLTSAPMAMLALNRLNVLDDPRVLHDHLRRIGENVDQDPALTIGAAKELVETICRVILADFDDEPAKDASLKDLYKAVAERLGLNREAVPGDAPSSQAARNALQAMMNVVGSLAEMRNARAPGTARRAAVQHLRVTPEWPRTRRRASVGSFWKPGRPAGHSAAPGCRSGVGTRTA